MKSIRVSQFGDPEVMGMEDVPDPSPGPGEVVVTIKAAGVNPVDTYIRSGTYASKPALPYTPGMDGAGEVRAVGEAVTSFQVGSRVYVAGSLSGTYAEEGRCAEFQVHPLPDRASYQQGAALGVPYGVAYRALFMRAKAKPGETVLVHGATGGVGIAAVQLARGAGLKVIGTGGTAKGRELALEQGAHHVLDHRSPDYLDRVLAVTRGRGVDVVLEMLANVNLGRDLKLLAYGGRVVVIGSRGAVEIDPRDAMGRDASILGVVLFNATRTDLAEIHAALGAGLESGTVRPVIGREIPLAEAAVAHREVMASGAHGKIVLIP